jgi:hypothetical protein
MNSTPAAIPAHYQQLFGGSPNLKLTFLILIAVVIGFMGSCKPKEKCPTYGKYHSKNANHHHFSEFININ